MGRNLTAVLWLVVLSLVFVPVTLHAKNAEITAENVFSSIEVEQALRENLGRATTNIQGKGAKIKIAYSSDGDIQLFMVPLDKNGQFVPTDFVRFLLPKAVENEVIVDISGSPGWKPSVQTWNLNLLTKNEETKAGFSRLEFKQATPLNVISASVKHLLLSEVYTPSSFHALRGYRVFGIQVTVVSGILMALVCFAAMLISVKERRLQAIVLIILLSHGIYSIRFAADLLRLSREHLSGYKESMYDEAGSVYEVASTIKKVWAENDNPKIYVCRDGSSYKEKILRYFTYPSVVSSDPSLVSSADFALVTDRDEWTFQSEKKGAQSIEMLRCGDLEREAQKIQEYPDGSVLFSLKKT